MAGWNGGVGGGYPTQTFDLPDQTDQMDCRAFQKDHVAFIDDTLSAVDMVGMQAHVAECESCSRHDASERRALLLFRNLPRLEPSADFRIRLESRLREARLSTAPAPSRLPYRNLMVAASLALLAGVWAANMADRFLPSHVLSLAPVVATIPEPASPLANPALVASVSTGMPVWPVALLAEQAPVHFANAEFQLTSFNR
ncbi:MAG: anti-sigma factor family protein [Gemmatimonadaceae bacterium]